MKNRRVAFAAMTLCCAAGMAQAQSFTESFDDILQLPANGWFETNQSGALGTIGYFQGNTGVFPAQATAGYLAVNFNSTSATNTISNWMLMPARQLANGQSLSFFTRTVDTPQYPDRLQVRMSLAGTGTNVGTGPTAVGDFTNLLLDINPTYTTAGYPNTWTQQNIVLSGIAAPTNGRLAFRYFVEGGGPTGLNSDYIGIDEVVYTTSTVLTGACCLPNGTCAVTSQVGCAGQNGIYRGDNTPCSTANCPQPPGCPAIQGSIPNAPTTWPSTGGTQTGRLYRDGVPDTCAAPGTPGTPLAGSFQYQKFDFVNTGGATCVTVNINTACTGTNFIYAGAYVGGYNPADPVANNVASIGGSPNPTAQMSFNVAAGASFSIVFAEVTANAGCPAYTFQLTGGQFNCGGPAPCYANCDGSTTAPILNVNDFICFQSKYAAQDPAANCDNSTTQPVLNVNDFICFQSRYAAGCP